MEFDFDINSLFPDEITHFQSRSLNLRLKNDRVIKEKFKRVIDHLGKGSAVAQSLPHPVTMLYKFLLSDDAQLFVLKDASANGGRGAALGFLKVGTKDLFLHNEREELVKTRPLCVLDFYVHESRQRQGRGKRLFDRMLEGCSVMDLKPRHIAYDRPSTKLIPFLRKHYGLTESIPQYNQFYIVSGFFDENPGQRGVVKFFPYEPPRSPDKKRSPIDEAMLQRQQQLQPFVGSLDAVDAAFELAAPGGIDEAMYQRQQQVQPFVGRQNAGNAASSIDEAMYQRQQQLLAFAGTQNEVGMIERAGSSCVERETNITKDSLSGDRRSSSPLDDQSGKASWESPKKSVTFHSSVDQMERIREKGDDARQENENKFESENNNDDDDDSPVRDWTKTERAPIVNAVPRPADPLDGSIASAFIWMPTTTSSSYRLQAPYATLYPKTELSRIKAELAAISGSGSLSLDQSLGGGSRRFSRTSLW